ncbi:CBF/Mak21 family-domain-containing protein, partial [Sparassis latifolia]
IAERTARASDLLAQDAAVYQASTTSTGDAHFMQNILARGTLSDRLSALTLLVQASPVHNAKALETLRGLAERGRGKGGREEGLKAVRCVVDWWVGGGAPGRKLRYFRDQPLLHPSVTDSYLVMWYFEDWLKKYFFSILQILETYSLDPLNYVRTQSLAFIATLLREKPEQEQNLLRLLVNKLGDTDKAICSRASYHLLQLLQAHPNMKAVVVREVKALIFRPAASTSAVAQAGALVEKVHTHIRFDDDEPKGGGAQGKEKKGKAKDVTPAPLAERWNTHAWYYAAVTLNQIVLTPGEHDRGVARTLIGMYFEMFHEILGTGRGPAGGERDREIVQGDDGAKSTAGKVKGKGNGKARAKEVRGEAGFAEVEDASSRMVGAVLTGVNRALPFARADVDEVLKEHIDTLFLITHTATFNISLQALLLIFHVCSSFAPPSASQHESSFTTALTDRFYRTLYASLVDPRLAESNKEAMYLNLLFKALKSDTNSERVKAFVRRFVQVLATGIGGSGGGPEFIAGGLYLLGELFNTTPGLKSLLGTPVPKRGTEPEKYDPHKRDPQFAHASASPMYELLPLLHHYHPAISLHARQLLASQPLTATPDLALNTLTHFLDRFVYKNPKKPKTKGASAMQPAARSDRAGGVSLVKGEVAQRQVNEERFWKRRPEAVPVDELFFHKFFTRKREKEAQMAAKVGKRKARGDASGTDDDVGADEDEEEESQSDDEPKAASVNEDGLEANEHAESDEDKEEAEIWKAMKASMPAELQDDDDELMDASDDVPLGLDDSDSDGDADEDFAAQSPANSQEEDDDTGDSLAEASDADDLLPLDGLIEYAGSDAGSGSSGADEEEEEWAGIGAPSAKKRKRDERGGVSARRKRLRALPTFASYDEYARMIEDAPEDFI